jgi:poly(3-hydroxybutyrate) depolymerase
MASPRRSMWSSPATLITDEQQVYAFGYSNGGHVGFSLAIEAPDEIAAIAAVAASLPHAAV